MFIFYPGPKQTVWKLLFIFDFDHFCFFRVPFYFGILFFVYAKYGAPCFLLVKNGFYIRFKATINLLFSILTIKSAIGVQPISRFRL